jgi:GT2 family glycosyltransferase
VPTLSILTPSYNYAWCIEDALASVQAAAASLPRGWEVEHVVVDDCSTDASRAVLERWADRITIELRRENHGQSNTLNRCLELASGEWIGWLNCDDFVMPYSLRDACAAFDGDDVIYGDSTIVDVEGRFTRLLPEHRFSLWTLRYWGTYLPVGSVFLRRSLVAQLGWREDLSLLLDWDLWLRAEEAGARFRYVSTPLAAARFHAGQESQQPRPGRLEEKINVRRAHGIPARPRVWRALGRIASVDHGLRKALDGAYAKQLRTRGLRGRSMRWFDAPADAVHVSALYEHGYPNSRPRVTGNGYAP